MYFFIEKSRQISSRSEQLGIDYQTLYNNTIQAFYQKYSLPALHEWGDGFVKGDASEDEIFELVKNINVLDGDNEPAVYAEYSDDDKILTDVYEYLDKAFIEMLEASLDAQCRTFGDEEFSKNQFETFKEKATEKIREHLKEEYYTSGGVINQDYSVFLLADELRVFEHVEVSSNWCFQKSNDARFQVLHLNNYDKAFEDYTDLIATCNFSTVRDNLDSSNEEVEAYFGKDFEEEYSSISYEERLELWKKIACNGIKEYDKHAREEAIDSIIDAIQWDEIENWFNAQFEIIEEEE